MLVIDALVFFMPVQRQAQVHLLNFSPVLQTTTITTTAATRVENA